MENLDLTNYIQQARKSGIGDNKIREGLLQAGWPVSSVEEAMMRAPVADIPQSRPKTQMSKSIAVILAVTAIAIAVSAGAYFWWQEAQYTYTICPAMVYPDYSNIKTGEIRNFRCLLPPEGWKLVEERQPSSEISTWKTYRNEEYGFEFGYPQDWTIADYSTNDLVYFYSNQNLAMDLLVHLKGSDEYFNDVAINAYDCGGDGNDTSGCALIPRQNSKLNIDGLIVYKSVGVNDTKYFIQNPNKQNTAEFYNVNETKADQILSTFRFTK